MIAIIITSIFFNLYSCQETIHNYKKYSYRVNNENKNSFGYKDYHDLDVGPTSIILDSIFVYIVDQYHSNIKRINLNTGEIKTSHKLGSIPMAWLRDIAIFNNRLYITTDLDSIYVLSKEFESITSLYMDKGEKYFSNIDENELTVYITLKAKLSKIGPDNNLIESLKILPFDIFKTPHGKEFRVYQEKDGKKFIKTPYDTIQLQSKYNEIFPYYNAILEDFSENKFVYFCVDSKTFTLHIYEKAKN